VAKVRALDRAGLEGMCCYAAALSSLSAPRATIFIASSGNSRCSSLASSQGRTHPDVALLVGRQDHRHRLGMDRRDDSVRRGGEKAVDQGPGSGFDFGPRSPLNSVQMPANAVSGRSLPSANHTTSFFLVSGFGSGACSAKLLNGTKQRFSGFSQPRQCGRR
jgi:hypothetical protein